MEPPTGKDIEIFLETCQAFKKIRDNKLYSDQFLSFDAYCRANYGKTAKEINDRIDMADHILSARN